MIHPSEFATEEVFALLNDARRDAGLPAFRYTSLESLLAAAEEAAAARLQAATGPPNSQPFARRETNPII